MRKLVRLTSGLFLNRRCPLWLQRKGLNLLGGYARLPKDIQVNKATEGDVPVWWFVPDQAPDSKAIIQRIIFFAMTMIIDQFLHGPKPSIGLGLRQGRPRHPGRHPADLLPAPADLDGRQLAFHVTHR